MYRSPRPGWVHRAPQGLSYKSRTTAQGAHCEEPVWWTEALSEGGGEEVEGRPGRSIRSTRSEGPSRVVEGVVR